MSRASVPIETPAALAARLVAPDAGECLAAVSGDEERPGPGAVVLDLRGVSAAEAARFAVARLEELAWLPCVTIALGQETQGVEGGAVEKLAAACDVRVPDEAALAPVLAGIEAVPIASLAFVQLLRAAPRRTIYEALVAESFVYSALQGGAEFQRWRASWRARSRPEPLPPEAPVRLERDRGRLEIHLTRAWKHNAFSRAMRDGLVEALQLALADPSIDELVLDGEGPSFCSGGDLDEFGSFPDPASAHAIRTTRSPALLLSRLAARSRVEVHGACIGAGVELPAFTHRVVAQEDAFFQLPELRIGLVPGAGGTASLPARIGRQRTAWLGLTGHRIDARTALSWGLVDEVQLAHHS